MSVLNEKRCKKSRTKEFWLNTTFQKSCAKVLAQPFLKVDFLKG